jgi:hypothetical protein
VFYSEKENTMSKDVINVHGEKRVVREDTAKAYRGVNWAYASIIGFIIIAALIAAVLFMRGARDGNLDNPAHIENTNRR